MRTSATVKFVFSTVALRAARAPWPARHSATLRMVLGCMIEVVQVANIVRDD